MGGFLAFIIMVIYSEISKIIQKIAGIYHIMSKYKFKEMVIKMGVNTMFLARELAKQQIREREANLVPTKGMITVLLGVVYIVWLLVRAM